MEFTCSKIAWKRDASVPPGQPAKGRFDCPCGHTIGDVDYGGPDNYECECGRVWDSLGWLVNGVEA